jgi:hypothetical protein
MAEAPTSKWRAFLTSPHHAAMALFTVGAGVATGEPLYLIIGATAYVLGWVYLPDTGWFRGWLDRRANAATDAAATAELKQFARRREALLNSLSSPLRERYHLLARVCRDIEKATADNEQLSKVDISSDTRLRKVDELMWMYLRLLSIQQSLEMFIETERREDVHSAVLIAEEETTALEAEVVSLGSSPAAESKQRLLSSRRERLGVLRKRMERFEEAEDNLQLVVSEQERLAEQIKLIRADALATKNAAAVSARIDASVAHLNETNRWLSQMDQFRDLAGDLPMTDARIGYEASSSVPPPLPASDSTTARPQQRTRQRQ